jgi:broad specificity phosphatase PhoE
MKKKISLTLVLTLCMVAKADFTFGEATNLGPTINTSSPDILNCISSDGLAMYLDSFNRPGGHGSWDIWISTRKTLDDEWGVPVNLGPPFNTAQADAGAYISSDGLELYFQSDRSGGYGDYDLYVTKKITTEQNPEGYWSEPQNLGPLVNTSNWDCLPWVSPDGLELYFSSLDRAGGYGDFDIWISRRPSVNSAWETPVNLGPVINTPACESAPSISSDGLLLLFSDEIEGPLRPGGYGKADMWMARRASVNDPWGVPLNLGPMVNTSSLEGGPRISPDGSMLYFCSERPGGYGGFYGDIYQAPIIPIVDLNEDGIVDSADMVIMVDHWGTGNSLCDIGPMPWGDGIVDVEDLKVLAEHLFETPPKKPQVTTVVVVRHAERANSTLTEDGEKRAETLARLLSNVGLSAIFSTNYTRTIETANNTADRLGIPIQFYTSVAGVADLIKAEYTGKVVLVVGHSNSVTQTVQALGVSSVPPFDGRYDNLYLVTIRPDGTALLTHLRFDIHQDL